MHGEVLPAEVEEEFEAAVGEAGERFRSPNRTRSAFTLATGWLTANTHDCALCSHDCGRADRPDLHYHEQSSHLIMAGRKRPDWPVKARTGWSGPAGTRLGPRW